MNFYKNLSIFINDRNNLMADSSRAEQAETDRFKSIFKMLDIEQFDLVFKKALDLYWGEDYSKIHKDDEVEFLKVLKDVYSDTDVVFQVKDADEFDFVFESGQLVEVKTTRYKVLKENLINSLEMDGTNGAYYVEKLLRAVKKKIMNEQKETS